MALDEILATYSRDRLKELCRERGLDDAGKEKATLVHRLLGREAAQEQPTERAPEVFCLGWNVTDRPRLVG